MHLDKETWSAEDEKEQFRCPFEVKGEETGKIISVLLSTEHESRMAAFAKGLSDFYADPELIGVRFVLPKRTIDGCQTLEDLGTAIFPFQCEQLAAEIEYRLYPFLPFQPFKSTFENKKLSDFEFMYLIVASELAEGIASTRNSKLPKSASDIANWLMETLTKIAATGIKTAQLCILDSKNRIRFPLLRTIPGSLVIEFERMIDSHDPAINRNLFGVVKCPLYPLEFGRYSEDVEFVLSREAHFASIPSPQRRKIRRLSNRVLQRGGIKIENLNEDKQNTGLWIPGKN